MILDKETLLTFRRLLISLLNVVEGILKTEYGFIPKSERNKDRQ